MVICGADVYLLGAKPEKLSMNTRAGEKAYSGSQKEGKLIPSRIDQATIAVTAAAAVAEMDGVSHVKSQVQYAVVCEPAEMLFPTLCDRHCMHALTVHSFSSRSKGYDALKCSLLKILPFLLP